MLSRAVFRASRVTTCLQSRVGAVRGFALYDMTTRPGFTALPVYYRDDGIAAVEVQGENGPEEIIIPDAEETIEWILSSPVDLHLFTETPIIKSCPEVEGEDAH